MILGHKVFRKKMRGLDKFIHWAHTDLSGGIRFLINELIIQRNKLSLILTAIVVFGGTLSFLLIIIVAILCRRLP